jgi:hypothetical protein
MGTDFYIRSRRCFPTSNIKILENYFEISQTPFNNGFPIVNLRIIITADAIEVMQPIRESLNKL